MRYFLLDACAVIYGIQKLPNLRNDVFKQQALGKAFLYIPQFCIVEVLDYFARKHFREKKLSQQQYEQMRSTFLQWVRSGQTIYCYDLHRYHIIAADAIYPIDHTEPPAGGKDRLYACDIMVIAMALELKRIHTDSKFRILTRDGRLQRIANKVSLTKLANWFD